MNLAYNYLAKANNQTFSSELIASSKQEAIQKIKDKNLTLLNIELNYNDSFAVLLSKNVKPKSLSLFYNALGLRLKNEMDPSVILRMLIKTQRDPRLRLMIADMEGYLNFGLNVGDAMEKSGFSKMDSRLIKSMLDSKKMGNTFISLANDYSRISNMQKQFATLMIEPSIIFTASLFIIWADFLFLVPKMSHFFKSLGESHLPSFVAHVINFGLFFAHHQPYASVVYFGAVIALIYFFTTKLFKELITNYIGPLKRLSVYSDQVRFWSGFILLYDTSNDVADSILLLREAASRKDTKNSLAIFSAKMREGVKPEVAVNASGFPEDIEMMVSTSISAPGKQAVITSLNQFIEALYIDLNELTAKVIMFSHYISLLFGAIIVMFLASTTVLPMLLATLSQV